MPLKFAVVSVWAEDVPTCAHFYSDVIGLDLIAHHGGRPHFDLGDVYLTILKGKPVPAQEVDIPRFPIFALSVDDLDAAMARLVQHGVSLPWGVEKNGQTRWVMFYDVAGNLIELVQFA